MMPDLQFVVQGVEPVPHSASPLLAFKLDIRQVGEYLPIHAIVLRCQVRIDPAKRSYGKGEQDKLRDLFDRPERWSQTLRSMLWANISVAVPRFSEEVTVGLTVPCTFDFNIAATKYFHAIEDGEAPLTFLFSGTIFHEADDATLRVAQISWEKEAAYRMPVRVWQQMMDVYYPNCAWLCLRRDAFDRLHDYKRRHGLPTWEAALERLLPAETLVTEGGGQ